MRQVPRYHARETAVARATMEGASVVLGSATPSVDAYFKAKQGEYTLLELTRRAKGQNLASVYTVDMREELKKGNRSIISDRLKELIDRPFTEASADHVVFEPARLCGIRFLQGLRICSKMSSLRCVAVGTPRRKTGLSLLWL